MKKNAHHYVRSVSFKWNAMEIEREKFYHCKVKRGLSISFDDFFGNGSLCNTAIHCLFFYVTVSIRFAHGEFTDQNPFCLVDQTDFSHFSSMDRDFLSNCLSRSLALSIQLRACSIVGFEVGFGKVKTPYSATLSWIPE